MTYPPCRFLEAFGIEHQGEQMIFIRDPERICDESLIVPLPVFLIMTLLDGQNDAAAIQTIITRATGGEIVPTDQIERIVRELDEFHLLDNERSRRRRLELEQEFAALATRPATHAGAAYPDDPAQCEQMLADLFRGLTDANGHAPRPRALVTPHIDIRVGGACMARTFARLDPARPPRLYVILGVAHQPTRNLFTLTDKDFATPLGVAATDRAAAARLRELYGADRLDGEYAHKFEHSVEFQVLFLQHLHRGNPDLRILPVLCGSVHEHLADGAAALERHAEVGPFIDALRRLVDEYSGDVCIIAGVDLSHVGQKFGDSEGVDELRQQVVRAADERMLAAVIARDSEAFFDHFRPDANARNVDGISAVYTMLRVIGAGRGELVGYEQWREEATNSMVTYAGLALY